MSKAFVVPAKEFPRIVFHGVILAFIIGGFWLMDSLKDPVLANLVGIEYQPTAKLISVLTTLTVVCLYDYLSSLVSKPNLFHIVAITFALIFVVISALLGDPSTGFENKDRGPHRWTGWAAYFSTEAYGSLMVALFWSYTNSIMDLEEAKGAYGLILSIAQLGAISGSTMAASAATIGIPQLFLLGAMHVFMVSLLIKVYNIVYHDNTSVGNRVRSISECEQDSEDLIHDGNDFTNRRTTLNEFSTTSDTFTEAASYSELLKHHVTVSYYWVIGCIRWFHRTIASFYEGLTLIMQHRYTLKLLGVSVLFEIVVTVLDYEFKLMGAHSVEQAQSELLEKAMGDMQSGLDNVITDGKLLLKGEISEADAHLHTHIQSAEDQFANLLGRFGQITNTLSLIIALFGFSYLLHKLSVQVALLIFPIILLISVILSTLFPTLAVMFGLLTILKALVFSLNEPVKELLYQPTSDAIKFKAKAWIDVVGSRLAKAAGSMITGYAAGDVHKLRKFSEVPCLLLGVFIVMLAWSIGSDFSDLIEKNLCVTERGIVNKQLFVASQQPTSGRRGQRADNYYSQDGELLVRNGLRPGDVGYDGYGLKHFEGVFDDDEERGEEATL